MKPPLLCGILLVSCAAAQAPSEPPPLIQLVRATGGDVASIRPYSNANAAVNVFGMRSITGVSETWLIELHDSFASIEDLDRAISSVPPVRGDSRTLVGLYRPAWSYRADLAVKVFPKARYFHVSLMSVRPGAGGELGELIRQRRSGFERINLDRPDIAYQVISGEPSEMCVFLAPLTSLKTLDDALANLPFAREAGPGPGNKTALDIEVSREHLLFRVDPRISWVSEGLASADPEFWGGRGR